MRTQTILDRELKTTGELSAAITDICPWAAAWERVDGGWKVWESVVDHAVWVGASSAWHESPADLGAFVEACLDEGMSSKVVAHLIEQPAKWSDEYHGWTERGCDSEWLGNALIGGVRWANEEAEEVLNNEGGE